ncbi:SPASM domain-containing protein [Turicibacter sanguinis]|uniref:radical SAM/SPASM domain-containing protein n=1 Tax=Turicibacter sanguinis TaxID=154288 RepID=UPI00232F781E|nr:radical SAM protein [Turicibacter sanguinis]MDB8543319.1 SPASM domain-containing protein [Turicibacter sanguinis]
MPRFKKIYVEITNRCNLKCDFCPSATLGRNGKVMNEDDFKHILKEVKPYTNYLYFHLLGEPFLNPRIGRFLEMSHEAGIQVNLTTNGVLIGKVKETLIQSPALRQINFSVHSFEANESTQTLKDYLMQIASFIDEIQAVRPVYCNLRLWNMDGEALQAKNTLNQQILDLIEEAFHLPYHLNEKLMETNNVKIRDRVFINMADKFEWPSLEREVISEKMFCYGLRDHIGIQADGTVVPCCLDSEGKIPLGNVFETPLHDILESERAKAMYDGFSNRVAVEELCKRCGYAKRY